MEADMKSQVDPSSSQDRPRIPDRILLFKLKGAEVCASLVNQEAQPWHLPVEGLVIPMGVDAGSYGNMAQAMKGVLGGELWDRLREGIQKETGGRIEPLKPVPVALDDELGPALLPNAPRRTDDSPARYHVIAATVGLAPPVRPRSSSQCWNDVRRTQPCSDRQQQKP